MNQIFNRELIDKYNKAGPRYTSYPTAVQFHENFTTQDYQKAALSSQQAKKPLSLYFHLPFCAVVCFYCACNRIITSNRKRSIPYLEHLFKEIEAQSRLFTQKVPVKQLHWGGGTPTFFNHEQMQALMEKTREHFQLLPDDEGEYSIEVDPREADGKTVHFLRSIGFNRLSMGVQDFDPHVQKAVNRIQPKDITRETLLAARESGFKSISLDLIYGLPLQTVTTFERTIDEVLTLSPDRLAVFNYAHMPHLFKMQRQMKEEDMPTPDEKLAILKMVIERLTEAGYIYIGMDHFAKPTDQLAIAQKEGNLYRNFQGYSTHSDCDLVGMGVSAISQIGDTYAQNTRVMKEYEGLTSAAGLAIKRGLKLTQDDLIRREVISEIMCNLKLDLPAMSKRLDVNLADYLAAELAELETMEADGLIKKEGVTYRVQEAGRLLIRNIGMVFDAHLKRSEDRFSKVI